MTFEELVKLYILQKDAHQDGSFLLNKQFADECVRLSGSGITKSVCMAPPMFPNQPEIPFVLFKPSQASSESPKPLIIHTHGGPDIYMHPNRFHAEIAYFLSKGYVVACPNYRGSSSYPNSWDDYQLEFFERETFSSLSQNLNRNTIYVSLFFSRNSNSVPYKNEETFIHCVMLDDDGKVIETVINYETLSYKKTSASVSMPKEHNLEQFNNIKKEIVDIMLKESNKVVPEIALWEEWVNKSKGLHHIYGPEDVYAVAKHMQTMTYVNKSKVFLRGCSYGSFINAHLLAGIKIGKFQNIFQGVHLSGGLDYPAASDVPVRSEASLMIVIGR